MAEILSDETIDELNHLGRKIIQKRGAFRFSMDAVLLAHFPSYRPSDSVLDLGTGTGIVPLLMAEEAAHVDAVEIDGEMAEMARRSVAMNGLEEKVTIIRGDYREIDDLLPSEKIGRYDIVIANPPYYKAGSGKASRNESVRIARHEVNATLDDTIRAARLCLRPRGRLAMIHIAERLDEIILTMKKYDFAVKRIRLVQPNEKKGANLVLMEAAAGGKSGAVRFLPALIVYGEDGNYTREILEIYGMQSGYE